MTRTARCDRHFVSIGEAQQHRYGFRAAWQHDDVRLVRGEPLVARVFCQNGGCKTHLPRRQKAPQLGKEPNLFRVHQKRYPWQEIKDMLKSLRIPSAAAHAVTGCFSSANTMTP